jgi:hypothetical protein
LGAELDRAAGTRLLKDRLVCPGVTAALRALAGAEDTSAPCAGLMLLKTERPTMTARAIRRIVRPYANEWVERPSNIDGLLSYDVESMPSQRVSPDCSAAEDKAI